MDDKKANFEINVLAIKENKDGSANVTFEMADEAYSTLFIEGMRLLIPPHLKNKIAIIPVSKYDVKSVAGMKTVDFPVDEADALVGIAINHALLEYIKQCDEGDKNTIDMTNKDDDHHKTSRCDKCGRFLPANSQYEYCEHCRFSTDKDEMRHQNRCGICGKFLKSGKKSCQEGCWLW